MRCQQKWAEIAIHQLIWLQGGGDFHGFSRSGAPVPISAVSRPILPDGAGDPMAAAVAVVQLFTTILGL